MIGRMDPGAAGREEPGDATAQGVDHLQRAGRELIAAARSFLDAAEQLVEDRTRLADMAGSVANLVEELAGGVRAGGRGPGAEDLQPWEQGAAAPAEDASSRPSPGAAGAAEPDGAGGDAGQDDGEAQRAGGDGAGSSGDKADRRSPRVRRIPVE